MTPSAPRHARSAWHGGGDGRAKVLLAAGALVAAIVFGLWAWSGGPERESTQDPGRASSKNAGEGQSPLTVAFLGDSYVEGEGAKRPEDNRWTARVSKRFGWKEVNLGLGGTGYTTPGPKENATTYVQRVDAVKEADPDVVVVSGGRNDVLAKPERVRTAAVELFRSLEQLKGSPEVVVVAPLWDASDPPKRFDAVGRAVQAAARTVGVVFVPLPRQPLAGRPQLLSSDKLHPTASGYAVIARSLAPRLEAAVGDR